MSTRRLSAYLFVAGALPGAFLANASSMFFKTPPAMFWLQGMIAGGLVGVVLAFMIVGVSRRAAA
jgi:zinc transporter ZupT